MDSEDLCRPDRHQLVVLDEQGGELHFFFGKGDDEFFALRAVQLHVVSAHQPSIRLMMDCRFPWLPLLMTSDKDVSSTYSVPSPIVVGG